MNPEDEPRFLRELRPHTPPVVRTVGQVATPGSAPAYVRAAFDAELDDLATRPQGERNDHLNIASFNLGQLVGSGHLAWDATFQALYDVGVMIGLTANETRSTINSGLRAGQQKPRDVPSRNGVPRDADSLPILEPSTDGEPPADGLVPVDWKAAFADEAEEDWIVEPLIPARRLVALFSPPKLGKSLLMLELAAAIAQGRPALGVIPDRQRRVLYVDFENDLTGDVVPRLRAMGHEADDLANLLYLSFPSLPALDTAMGGMVLLAACDRLDIEVVVIDTISRAVGGEENTNDTWLSFYKHTGVALKARGIATVRLDHTGKDQTKGMRGGSAKYGDVDAVWAMTGAGDETFQLECTAQRLPIKNKLLLIRRDLSPLHHEVVAGGRAGVVVAEVQACIKKLDELEVPNSTGLPDCCKALGRVGLYPSTARPNAYSKRTVDSAREGRQLRSDRLRLGDL